MQEATAKERLMIMQENASKVEETTYQKSLSIEDLIAKREDLSDNLIQLGQKEDEFNEVKATFKAETDPIKQVNKVLLSEIKTKQSTVAGVLYHMANHEEGMMETYDHEGALIGTRRLRPDEKQGNVFQIKKAVNE